MNNITKKIIQEIIKKNKEVEIISLSIGNDGIEEYGEFYKDKYCLICNRSLGKRPNDGITHRKCNEQSIKSLDQP